MSTVQVIQRNAHLAGAVRLDQVQGSTGPVARATFIAISNRRRGSGEERTDEPTAIRWTLWGRLAESAAQYLGKGSHVNVVGSVRSDDYTAADGSTAHAMAFTADEVDYLDTRAESEARRERHAFVDELQAGEGDAPSTARSHRYPAKQA